MRTTFQDATVRLYHLDSASEAGGAETLFYGSLGEAVRIAEAQPRDLQEGLYLATENDVIAWLDFIGE